MFGSLIIMRAAHRIRLLLVRGGFLGVPAAHISYTLLYHIYKAISMIFRKFLCESLVTETEVTAEKSCNTTKTEWVNRIFYTIFLNPID